jgi:flagellar hook-associated protein 2
MATVSSLGVGSGLDLNSLLANIKSAEQAPLAAIQKQQASYTSKLSAYGQLNSALSALQTAAAALAKPALFQGVKASSSATDVVTATALSTAASGSYALDVKQLSQAQSLATGGVVSTTDAIGGGRVTIEFGAISGGTLGADGKYSGAGFAADSARTQSIDIDPTKSSLEDIAKAINAKTTLGVTASIVNDGSATPNRLVLTSKQTGETSSMKIAVTADPAWSAQQNTDNSVGLGALQSLLNHDPQATQNLQQTAAAQNAQLTVNGIAITSATNTVKGAIQDVDMTVAKIGLSTVEVKQDADSVQGAVTTFVKAYNDLQTLATKLTAFDATSKSGAVLLGDSTLRNIQANIRSALTSAQPINGSGLTMLSQIGITFEKDGTLAIDSSAVKFQNPIKLADALSSNMSGVATLFAGTGGVGGYGSKLSSLLTSFTDTNGMLSSATKGMNKSLEALGKKFTATSERIDATVARYKAQFTQLDGLMSSMNQTSSYLTQQFDSLNSKK